MSVFLCFLLDVVKQTNIEQVAGAGFGGPLWG